MMSFNWQQIRLLIICAAMMMTFFIVVPSAHATTEDQEESDSETTTTTSEDNDSSNIENAIKEKQSSIDDSVKEMAQQAFVNGSCLDALDKMRVLAHPDIEVAKLGIDISTCGDDSVSSAREMLEQNKK
jgi:uncharacterized protein YpmS